MTHRFTIAADPSGTEIRLEGPRGRVPYDLWAVEAPDALVPGVDLAQRLIASDVAIADEATVLVDHRIIAGLSSREAASLGLPPPAEAVAQISFRGVITRANFEASLVWARPGGQPILGATRTGTWLTIGGELRRLVDPLYGIAEAVDALNAAPSGEAPERWIALERLQEALPEASDDERVEASGLAARMTIAVADSFSLDLKGDGAASRLVPVLHRAGTNSPLLPDALQAGFGERQFNGYTSVRPVYALGGGHYVVLQVPLRRALGEVRKANAASPAARRVFMANPRAVLRDAIGDEVEDVVLEGLFQETPTYADRVLGLGLWVPRVVPWIALAPTDWFGPAERAEGGGKDRRPQAAGIVVGDRKFALSADEAAQLAGRIEEAMAAGHPVLAAEIGGETVSLPATAETVDVLRAVETAGRGELEQDDDRPSAPKPVLLIETNEEEVRAEADVADGRPGPAVGAPAGLSSSLKEHQAEGLAWLQHSWLKGLPGVLLADDMGLGKTIQGLAFLLWLRRGMTEGLIPRAPILIVAPTGLLQNWREEHDRHLVLPGLGFCTEAYGAGLRALKCTRQDGSPGLDRECLSESDWILTTYETLRDYQADFGLVPYAAALLDEAQKVKTPAARITDAAKAVVARAEFRVALTGTPVENRLADLWCITDTVRPGYFGDLKAFSGTYERDLDAERLTQLKTSLERPLGGRPQLMLRRMARDRLPDVPRPEERPHPLPMPARQRAAYDAVLAEVREAREAGGVLAALQRLRSVSLHPDLDMDGPDEAFLAASARLQGLTHALDEARDRGEKALVFVLDKGLQSRLSGILQRRYGLSAPPAIINGEVAGKTRQARVNAFQRGEDGFDAMILSPMAAGVGLTLTRANHVVHLSRWWNPAVEDQCTGRALRIGQRRQVYVHVPMAVRGDGAPSFDENLDRLLQRKRRLMRDALMPSDATMDSDRDELLRATVDSC